MTSSNQNRALLREYLDSVKATHGDGDAGEHAYRGAFENLIGGFEGGHYRAINEPLNVAIGQPDFIVQGRGIPVGYIECKDIGTDLLREENSEQLKRYRNGLHNLILTDYLTFRWYVNGDFIREERLATLGQGGRLETVARGNRDLELLLRDFLSQDVSLVDNPRELARRMAAKARLLRETTRGLVEAEAKEGRVFPLLKTYRELLVSDLNGDDFADMYAQTATYGLFAAWQRHPTGTEAFTRQSAVFTQMTPFLQEALGQVAGPRTQDRLVWIIDDLAKLLDRTDREAIMRGFGRGPGQDDPLIHFYEDFLAAYDSDMREKRGVYYTPLPVVSYIVRSIDHLLRDEFGITDGLADTQRIGDGTFHRVTILDPAVGTGTFLREVVANVRQTVKDKGLGGIWPQYVKDDLLPRLHGFELLMAPYTVSHMSLEIALVGDGSSGSIDLGDGINIVLTNTLEPAHEAGPTQPGLGAESMEEESARADDVKRDRPVMVVLGNPPYSGHSANKGKWIRDLLRGKADGDTGSYFHVDGEPLGERNPKWLNDDYVKFIRFAQWRIQKTGEGILGFVTNHSYLDSPTFRAMRRSLMQTFDHIYILDLHGNAKRGAHPSNGGKDENVFDIQQGVAIVLLIKKADGVPGFATVRHADLWGSRSDKYEQLAEQDVDTTKWTEVSPRAPQYFFVPRDNELESEYEGGFSVPDIFPVNSVGIVTARDKLTIQWSREDIVRVVEDFVERESEDARDRFSLPTDSDWKVADAQSDIRDHPNAEAHVADILYRPFDTRATYYTGKAGGFMVRPRPEVMRHMLAEQNLGLVTTRQQSQVGIPWSLCGVTRWIIESCAISNKTREINYLMPLYLHPTDKEKEIGIGVKPNLDEGFIEAVSEATGLAFKPDGPGDLESTFGPEDVFHYIYGILHSPTYRTRYADFLKSDFPRIPLTRNLDLFRQLITLGRRLTELHLMEAEPKAQPSFPSQGTMRVDYLRFLDSGNNSGQVNINRSQYFEGVSEATWEFTIGGYRPAQKWLKDRKGRTLTADDIRHYRKMCGALAETQELMAEIDIAIDGAGGWPLS